MIGALERPGAGADGLKRSLQVGTPQGQFDGENRNPVAVIGAALAVLAYVGGNENAHVVGLLAPAGQGRAHGHR